MAESAATPQVAQRSWSDSNPTKITGSSSNPASSAKAPIAFGTAAKSGRISSIDYSSSGPDSLDFEKPPELQGCTIPGVPIALEFTTRRSRVSFSSDQLDYEKAPFFLCLPDTGRQACWVGCAAVRFNLPSSPEPQTLGAVGFVGLWQAAILRLRRAHKA